MNVSSRLAADHERVPLSTQPCIQSNISPVAGLLGNPTPLGISRVKKPPLGISPATLTLNWYMMLDSNTPVIPSIVATLAVTLEASVPGLVFVNVL